MFSRAVEFVLDEEGGYVDDPRDAGGETKYGISKRAYPDLDIKALTRDQAILIYQRDYWDNLPTLPDRLALVVFDFAVNSGIHRAVKTLQVSLGVIPDGVFGPISRRAMKKHSEDDLLVMYTTDRIRTYATFKAFPVYGKGWIRRSVRAYREAIK